MKSSNNKIKLSNHPGYYYSISRYKNTSPNIKFITNIIKLNLNEKNLVFEKNLKIVFTILNLNNYSSISIRINYKNNNTNNKNLYFNIMSIHINESGINNYDDISNTFKARLKYKQISIKEVSSIHFHIFP